jgi:hypothetical protein
VEVLQGAFDCGGKPDVVGRFSSKRGVAHLEVCRTPHFLWRNARVALFLFRQVAMKREFFRELPLSASAVKQILESPK